jgi:hypothetical protein
MEKTVNIYQKLLSIQNKLEAPKNQFNKFGNYKYRSCEDILEGLKPLLKETRCIIKVTDEIVNIGDRYYVKATAMLLDVDTQEAVDNTAYAREEESKKGMDGSQVTGASSSYARKYALNGLFAIDDTKDSDSTNKGDKEHTNSDAPKYNTVSFQLSEKQINRAFAIASSVNVTKEDVDVWIKKNFNKNSIKELTKAEYDGLCNALEAKKASGQ